MIRSTSVILCTLTVVLVSVTDVARAQQGTKNPPVQLNAIWENDSSFISPLNPNDRYYTNGIRINLAFKPEGLTELLTALPFSPADGGDAGNLETALGLSTGQNIYTPGNIKRRDLIEDDRPYAGWLYGGVYVQRANDHVFDHLELLIGTTGERALVGKTQRYIHEVFDQVEPRGWRHQLENEVGFNVTYRRKWKLALHGEPGRGGAIELIPQAGLTLGTVNRHYDAGALLRGGWNLPYDFGPARIEDPASATHIHRKSYSPGVYAYVRVNGRVVEHDTFIEGNNFRDSHGVDAKPLFGEFEGGFVMLFSVFGQDTFQLGWSHTVVGEQFEGQDEEHHIGRWNLMWTFHY